MAPVQAFTDAKGRVSMKDPETGERFWVTKAQLQDAADIGLVGVTPDDHREYELSKEYEDKDLEAIVYGGLGGATMGLSTAIATGLDPSKRDHIRRLQKAHPVKFGISDVAGSVLSAAIPGAPLARLGGLGAKAAAGLGRGRGAQFVARGLTEGAGMGAGSAVSKGAITGDYSGTDIAKHAAYGAALSGALSLAGHGIVTAGRKIAGRGAARKAQALSKAADTDAAMATLGRLQKRIGPLQKELEASRGGAQKLSALDKQIAKLTTDIGVARKAAVPAAGRAGLGKAYRDLGTDLGHLSAARGGGEREVGLLMARRPAMLKRLGLTPDDVPAQWGAAHRFLLSKVMAKRAQLKAARGPVATGPTVAPKKGPAAPTEAQKSEIKQLDSQIRKALGDDGAVDVLQKASGPKSGSKPKTWYAVRRAAIAKRLGIELKSYPPLWKHLLPKLREKTSSHLKKLQKQREAVMSAVPRAERAIKPPAEPKVSRALEGPSKAEQMLVALRAERRALVKAGTDVGKAASLEARLAKLRGQMGEIESVVPIASAAKLARTLRADSRALGKLMDDESLALMGKIQKAAVVGMEDTASKTALMSRLGGWIPKAKRPPWLIDKATKEADSAVQQLRQQSFQKSGGSLKALSGAAGLVAGVATESILLGGAVGLGGRMLLSGFVRRLAGGTIRRSGRLITRAAIGSAKTGSRVTTKVMSQAEIEDIDDAVKDTDPVAFRADVVAGYTAAELEPATVEQLADFQTQRLIQYQQAAPEAAEGGYGARAKFTRLDAALRDPRTIVKRAEQMQWTAEDQEVLARYFPRHHDLLMDEWQRMLDEDKKLPWAVKNHIKNGLDPMRAASIAVASAQLYGAGAEEAPPSPKSSKFPTGASPLDRISAQSGLYGGKKA